MLLLTAGGLIPFTPDIVEYEVNHAEMAILFVEEAKLGKVANVLAKCKDSLKYVVPLPAAGGAAAGGHLAVSDAGRVPFQSTFESAGVALLSYEELLTKGAASRVAPCPAGGDDLAFIMYTSGTTGDPKGVCISQRAITVGASYCAGIELLPTDRYLSYLPLAHIFETMVEHALLSVGACVGFYGGDIKRLQVSPPRGPRGFSLAPRAHRRRQTTPPRARRRRSHAPAAAVLTCPASRKCARRASSRTGRHPRAQAHHLRWSAARLPALL